MRIIISSVLKVESKPITAKQEWLDSALWYFFVIKICTFIPMRFYFGFQKNFMTDSLTSKFYFISALTLSQIVLYFSHKSSSSIKKYIHLVAYHCIFISTCFRKLYIAWLKFMVIIQVTSKAFIVFFFQTLLDTNTFSISTSFWKNASLCGKTYLLKFRYPQTLKFLYPFFVW